MSLKQISIQIQISTIAVVWKFDKHNWMEITLWNRHREIELLCVCVCVYLLVFHNSFVNFWFLAWTQRRKNDMMKWPISVMFQRISPFVLLQVSRTHFGEETFNSREVFYLAKTFFFVCSITEEERGKLRVRLLGILFILL